MAKKYWYPCADCGTTVKKQKRKGKPVLCLECGVRRLTRAATEMANKSGRAYSGWQQSAGPNGRPRRHDMWE